jgi:hypothetical protein
MMSDPSHPTAPPGASIWLRFARLSTTSNGRLLLAALLFGLAEMFALPILVIALAVMPFRGGVPVVQAAPELFWICLLAALAIPAVCSLVFLVKMRQISAHQRHQVPPSRRGSSR